MPLPRSLELQTSVTTAVLKLMFPLLIPPIMRDITNNVKLLDTAQIA